MRQRLPGIATALAIAIPAYFLGQTFPIIGGPVFGILLGIILATFKRPAQLEPGIKYTGKKILQYAIIFLGFEMNLHTVLTVGGTSFSVMLVTLATAFITAFIIGRLLRVDNTATLLVGAGTAICGGSAIAAVAPVIDAKEKDIAMSISTIFLFNVIAVFIFPAIGHAIGMSNNGFGMWAGTAINDTSSVVAAGYSYSNEAGNYATIVKLTRALMIVPVCIIIGAARIWYLKRTASANKSVGQANNVTGQTGNVVAGDAHAEEHKVSIARIMPWFIVWFLVASIIRTVLPIPDAIAHALGSIGKFMIIAAMATIGLNTNLIHLLKNGARPILLGAICWFAVAAMSIVMQYQIGLL